MSPTNRREMLGQAAFAGAAGILAGPGIAHGADVPDAELLAAWEQRLATFRAYYAGRIDEDAFNTTLDQLEATIAALPAQSAAGIAVKLKLAFHGIVEPLQADEVTFVTTGKATKSMLGDDRHRLLWEAVVNLEALAGRTAA